MPLSTYLDNKVIADNISSGPVYVALHSTSPTKSGLVGETSTGRQAATFAPPTNGTTANTAEIVWTTTYSGVISDFSVWTALTGGNCLGYGSLPTSRTLDGGATTLTIPVGDLDITVD